MSSSKPILGLSLVESPYRFANSSPRRLGWVIRRIFPVGSRIPEALSPSSIETPRGGPLRCGVFFDGIGEAGGDGTGAASASTSSAPSPVFWRASSGRQSSVASAMPDQRKASSGVTSTYSHKSPQRPKHGVPRLGRMHDLRRHYHGQGVLMEVMP